MAGIPQHTPYDDFSRAVQAYSWSRLHGGTLARAEQAAGHAFPGVDIPDVASASAGARQAAAAFGRIDPAAPGPAGGNVGRQYGLGAGRATPAGATHRTVTAAVEFVPRGQAPRWISVQLDVPIGANAAAVQAMIIQTAQDAVEGPESDYPGTVLGIEVQTVIGQ